MMTITDLYEVVAARRYHEDAALTPQQSIADAAYLQAQATCLLAAQLSTISDQLLRMNRHLAKLEEAVIRQLDR